MENTFTDSTNNKPPEPEYEAIENMRRDCDVKMDTNPAYQVTS